MRVIVAAIVVLGLAGSLRAQPRDEPPKKSVTTALAWSLGVTAVGIAAGVDAAVAKDPGQQAAMFAFGSLGLLAGPSIGRIYAHRPWSAGLLVRAVGFTGLVVGEAVASACLGAPHGSTCPTETIRTNAFIDTMAGVAVLGAIFDLASTPAAVEDYNRSIAIVPTGNGIALAGTF